jgi:hypothetical protein
LSAIFIVTNAYSASIEFSNFDSSTYDGLAIVDSAGEMLSTSAIAEVGYFTDEAAVRTGDFDSWMQFGSIETFGAGYAFLAVYSGSTDASTSGDSSFIGKNITTFITNRARTEYLIAKSSQTFGQDNPLFTATVNLYSDSGISYLFGGTAGPTVDYGAGPQNSIVTSSVAEGNFEDNTSQSDSTASGDADPVSESSTEDNFSQSDSTASASENLTSAGSSDNVWYSDSVDLGNGWRWTHWLGYFNVGVESFIYHSEHKWLYVYQNAFRSNGVYFRDDSMGSILWTSENVYPFLYRFSDGEWIWYKKGSKDPRWFNKLGTGEWEQQ